MGEDATEKANERKKRPKALIFIVGILAVLAIAAGLYLAFNASSCSKAPENGHESTNGKDDPAKNRNNGQDPQNDDKKNGEDKDDPEKDPDKDPDKDLKNDPNGEDPKDDPDKDPKKDPNENGENGNKGNGETSQVWHPAWDEWVVSGYYETRYIEHPATYKEVIHPAQGYYAAVCNTCGAIFGPGSDPSAPGWHLINTGHDSYKTGVWIVTSPAWVEQVLVTAAWTEAVQVWIDTSHWVRHEGYWQ